jgi:hypothetical protein
MKDLGLMHYYLGLEVWNKRGEIILGKGKYIVKILQKFGMTDCKSMVVAPEMLALEVTPGLQQEQSPTPINLCHDLFIEGDQMEENSKQYRSNSETRLDTHR